MDFGVIIESSDPYKFFLLGYLIGSIPFSQWVALTVKGIDLRTAGYQNVGAYNVIRHVGVFWGFSAGGLDFAKGWIAMWVADYFLHASYPVNLLTAFAVIIGHNYPIWLRFRGGKGVGPMIGIIFWFAPFETFLGFILASFVFIWKQRINLATPVGALTVLLLTWNSEQHQQLLIFMIGFTGIIGLAYSPRFYRWLKSQVLYRQET